MRRDKRHHTVRTVMALCGTFVVGLGVLGDVLAGRGADYKLVAVYLGFLVALYAKSKGKGEEDTRSDESVL